MRKSGYGGAVVWIIMTTAVLCWMYDRITTLESRAPCACEADDG